MIPQTEPATSNRRSVDGTHPRSRPLLLYEAIPSGSVALDGKLAASRSSSALNSPSEGRQKKSLILDQSCIWQGAVSATHTSRNKFGI